MNPTLPSPLPILNQIETVHDLSNPSLPETWKWMLNVTWRDATSNPTPTDPAAIRETWMKWTTELAEPFRSVFSSLPEGTRIWCDRLSQWPSVQWDNREGRVTLAGDAAHPMTYRE